MIFYFFKSIFPLFVLLEVVEYIHTLNEFKVGEQIAIPKFWSLRNNQFTSRSRVTQSQGIIGMFIALSYTTKLGSDDKKSTFNPSYYIWLWLKRMHPDGWNTFKHDGPKSILNWIPWRLESVKGLRLNIKAPMKFYSNRCSHGLVPQQVVSWFLGESFIPLSNHRVNSFELASLSPAEPGCTKNHHRRQCLQCQRCYWTML